MPNLGLGLQMYCSGFKTAYYYLLDSNLDNLVESGGAYLQSTGL